MTPLARLLVLACLVVAPAAAGAAGFAKQSIFLSQGSVTEGETVLVHAVVANDDGAAFAGALALSDNDGQIGSVPVSLKAGEAAAVSVSWKPAPGSQKVTAELKNKDGEVVEQMSETFAIKEKPKPVEEDSSSSRSSGAAAIESSDAIKDAIGGVSPGVLGVMTPVFDAIDSGRNTVADTLDTQLVVAKAKVGKAQDADDAAPEGPLPDVQGGFWLALWTIYFYILTVLRFLVGNAALFYPVFALAILYMLWKTFRRFGRR